MNTYIEKNTFVFKDKNLVFKISELEYTGNYTEEPGEDMKYKVSYYDSRYHESIGYVYYIPHRDIMHFLSSLRDFVSTLVIENNTYYRVSEIDFLENDWFYKRCEAEDSKRQLEKLRKERNESNKTEENTNV